MVAVQLKTESDQQVFHCIFLLQHVLLYRYNDVLYFSKTVSDEQLKIETLIRFTYYVNTGQLNCQVSMSC